MKRKIKNNLDNPNTTNYQATQAEIFEMIEGSNPGDFLKVAYRRKANRKDRDAAVQNAFNEIENMDLKALSDGKHKKVIKHALNEYKGEFRTRYYKRTNELRDNSGYVLFQDEKNDWKKVDVRNIVSITNSDGVMLTRDGQQS